MKDIKLDRERQKKLLAALAAPEPQSDEDIRKHGAAMLANLRKNLKDEVEDVPMDDAYMRTAMEQVYKGARKLIKEVGDFPPLQFVFIGMRDKNTGKLAVQIMRQGLGLIHDKKAIVEAVQKGIEAVDGKLFVVLLDQGHAMHFRVKRGTPISDRIENGDLMPEDLAMAKEKIESAILMGFGLGVQYAMLCKIVRDDDGKMVDIEHGDIVCSRDEGAKFGGNLAVGNTGPLN